MTSAKIHYTIVKDGIEHEDEAIFTAQNEEHMKEIIAEFMKLRGLDAEKNSMWSEILK